MQAELQSLIDQVRAAHAAGTPLRLQGGDSKSFWVCAQAERTLDIRPYRGVVDYEPSELVLTVRAGTPLSEVEALLGAQGQMLAFEPPHYGPNATLGGTIACGLSGPRRAAAGSARDFVLGVRLIDGLGRDLSFGGQVIKNVAGFDLSRLMAGAFGSLGVITEVSLKVLPRPPFELTLEWALQEGVALERMNQWGGQPLPVSATSFHNGRLRARLSGAEVAVRAAQARLGGEVVADGAAWWSALREQSAACFQTDKPLWRLAVKSSAPPLGLSGALLTEWGGALRWLASEHAASQVQKAACDAGGHALLLRGGHPAAPCFGGLDPILAQIHRRLKHAFDPKGILNPGLPGNF
ncbi:MAG: glycolate oxidase subunit GlcE [Betaproteobacteria bacterium]|nr:glycolate oxidase subunit GlcE [Betaproteobacteria bacterium]